jgi:hypothetical protein
LWVVLVLFLGDFEIVGGVLGEGEFVFMLL